MSMADAIGIITVPHALIKSGNKYAYITKRIDRIIDGDNVKKLAMEDFCQLDFRVTEDKYKGSYERCAKVIDKYSFMPGLDKAELFLRLIFSFVTGNSDMHLKNFSLIEEKAGNRVYKLSPAYGLLPVNVIMLEDKEELALPLNGKKTHIRKKDFFVYGKECDLSLAAIEKMIQKVISMKQEYIKMIHESLLPNHLKKRFIDLIEQRTKALE